MYFEGKNRIFMAGRAYLLGEVKPGIEVATSEWAAKYITPNEANSYILGRFVEADKANNNKQYFKMGDLLMSQPTISYAPLNVNHDPNSVVGSFIASEMQYPLDDEGNPYIEALSAFWRYYYPEAFAVVQTAFAEGALFYSMEAVPRTISTMGGADDTAAYAYEGRTSPNYPVEINERSCQAIVLNQPHFIGGALIVPPARPGWSNADIKQVSKFVHDQWETAEEIYNGVREQAPHLDPGTWELVMGELILMAEEQGGTLSSKQRDNLKTGDFALPEKRAYPIHDLAHARNALARVAQHGTPEEKSRVRSAVYKKYPALKNAS